MVRQPEPWPLPRFTRLMVHAVTEADAFMTRWDKKTDEQPRRTATIWKRDMILKHLELVETLRDTDVEAETDLDFQRERDGPSIRDCFNIFDSLLERFRETTNDVPIDVFGRGSQELEPLRCMLLTHILVGQSRNPTKQDDNPYVYATLLGGNKVIWRTFREMAKPDHCAVFVHRHAKEIQQAAEKRENEVDGVRMAFKEGYIALDEISLLNECHHSIAKAVEIGRELGLSGGSHQIDAQAYRQQWNYLRDSYRARLNQFFQLSGNDERFRETTIARAAASWVEYSGYLPVGAAVDDNVDLYMWDYCFQYGNTKTWVPSITVSKQHPVAFAAQWNQSLHTDYNGPFTNRQANDWIFSIENLPDLVALAPVAAANLTNIPIPIRGVDEATAVKFFGKCVVDSTMNQGPGNVVFLGRPMRTTNWAVAMQQVYAGRLLPPIPHTFLWPKVPTYPAADVMRAAAREDYENFYDTVHRGGIKAYNSITVQTMRRLHEILTHTLFDMPEWQRISDLLRVWLLDENDTMLEVTTANAIASAREIQRIHDAAMER